MEDILTVIFEEILAGRVGQSVVVSDICVPGVVYVALGEACRVELNGKGERAGVSGRGWLEWLHS